MFAFEYLGKTQTSPAGIRRLEENVVGTLPDKSRRLEWFRNNIEELDAVMEINADKESGRSWLGPNNEA